MQEGVSKAPFYFLKVESIFFNISFHSGKNIILSYVC
jgi:hypothetical protein